MKVKNRYHATFYGIVFQATGLWVWIWPISVFVGFVSLGSCPCAVVVPGVTRAEGKQLDSSRLMYWPDMGSIPLNYNLVNSTSNLSIPIPNVSIPFFTYYFLPWVGTPVTFFKYLLRVVYIPIRLVMEEICLN